VTAQSITHQAPAKFVYPKDEPTFRVTRTFDAPRALVYEAFTKPEHMARWWGPRRYTSVVHEFDARPGGKWRISHRADGESHDFFGEFRELKAPEKIVQTFGYLDFTPSVDEAHF
jgi:uncharacterized protein YndB with AHSA1/START domain